jgi:hypothetical protein
MRKRCLPSPVLFNIVLKSLARSIRQEKEIKGIQILKEEVKLSLFSGNMILYLNDPKKLCQKLLNFKNTFSEIAINKINAQNSVANLCTNNE